MSKLTDGETRRGLRLGLRLLGAASLATGLGLGSVVLGAPWASASPTVAPNVSCGQTITTSTILTATLTCREYSGNDLVIGASGVTLNLNGHTIFSESSYYTEWDGIFAAGVSDVTIKNGVVATAPVGVYAAEDTHLTVSAVRVVQSDEAYNFGFELYGLSHALVTRDTASGEIIGLTGRTIITSTFSTNTFSTNFYFGAELGNLSHDTVVKSLANHDGFDGVYLYGRMTSVIMSANRANGDGRYGFYALTTRPSGMNIDISDPYRCWNVLCIVPGHIQTTGETPIIRNTQG